jgi:uncharacterized protein YyaL (SSP411 family)
MHNPVDWHPWGAEALERARREDRPLLVSIGYSACHWCHVMERESFEDAETAALMNRLFVNVKVDREERPDVDRIYMDTVTALTGHGGWPLTVFCTPEGRPFYGGTYYPPEPRHGLPSFRQLLEAVERAYRTRGAEVRQSAAQIVEALGRRPSGVASEPPGISTGVRGAQRLLQGADPEHGGFGRAPKFPTPPNLDLLLAACDHLQPRKAREALDHLVLTCREMARGGVYDQLGGGFHRYSVDAHWGVPHFEKMLYDQGQLLRTYAEAWRRTGGGDDDLAWPVRETAEWLAREMRGPEGAFYASLDADNEGEEGTFYVWTPEQLESALGGESAAAFGSAYGVTPDGNFDGATTVLSDRAREPRDRWASERAVLLRARDARPRPATDRKRVAAWNGLAISGLARAGSTLAMPALVDAARSAAEFALGALRNPAGRLQRIFDGERARIPAFLDDHAALLEGFLDLHRAGAGDAWLAHAVARAETIALRFYDCEAGALFLTPDDAEPLVQRPRSDHDGATPGSTGWALLGLVRVATLGGRADLARIVESVLRTHAFALERAAESEPTLARVALLAESGLSVAVIAGDPDAARTRALADRARGVLGPEDAVVVVRPGAPAPAGLDPGWLAGREPRGERPTAWVCRGTRCSLPVTDPDGLVALATPAS